MSRRRLSVAIYMVQYHIRFMNTRTQLDPTIAHAGDSQVSPNRRCNKCLGLFPIAMYSLAKYGPDGYSKTCKECYSQYLRLGRQKKYGSQSRNDDSLIRSVKQNNEFLLKPILGQSTTREIAGLSVVDGQIFKIFVGRHPETSMKRFTMFDIHGATFFEAQFSGGQDIIFTIINNHIRGLKIRLCPTTTDAELVKRMIYFL